MTAEGHVIFAIATTIFAKKAAMTSVITEGDWWHILPAALLTSLVPDIDHPKSFLGQRLKWISYPIARLCGHRGFTHSLLAVLAGLMLLQLNIPTDWLFPADVLQGMVLGYLSHIVADMLTPAGVPLLWPCRWRFRLPLIHNQQSNQTERLFCLILVGCALCVTPDIIHSMLHHWPDKLLNQLQLTLGNSFGR